MESLTLISIKAGGGRLDHVAMPPHKDLSIRITVNGQPLLSDFSLIKSNDKNNDWSYRINPSGILRLGRSPLCNVSLKEINSRSSVRSVLRAST